jgi:NADH:ubiquinone oxidoreductase subunit 5 (subunit L)/multisubunit Na+/H+ antiporter MnhA subunit
MPLTLFVFLIAAFAISGVPPLNGFFSKWMVYQGVIEFRHVSGLWPIFLIAAMFGSILTLASFLKLTHAMFLGERPRELNKVNETRFEMVVPALVLALLCIVFGVFANQIPLRYLIYSSLPSAMAVTETGTWSPWLATILILVGIAIGLVVFLFGTITRPRKSRVFVGGEIMDEEAARITGPNFYSSIYSFDLLKKTYQFGEGGAFDIYNHIVAISRGLGHLFKDVINSIFVAFFRFIGTLVRALSRLTSALHTGELYNYVGWIFLGGIVLMLLLFL